MRVKQGLSLIGYLCFIIYTVTLLRTSVGEYHNNIYNALPIWAWIAFTTSLVIGTLLLYNGIRNKNRTYQAYGVVNIALLFAVLWFYAELLGLRFWSAPAEDLLLHYGRAIEIKNLGTISDENLYPPIHILIAELSLVSRLPVSRFGPILSLIYYPLLIVGLVLVTRRYANTRVAMFTGVAGVPIFYWKYAHQLMPWIAYFALIPCLLLLLSVYQPGMQRFQRALLALGILMLAIGIEVGHPMSAIVAAIVIVTILVADNVGAKWLRSGENQRSIKKLLLLPLLIVYPMWYLSQTTFQRFFSQAMISIVSTSATPVESEVSRASGSGYTTWQLVTEWIIGLWGTGILILVVGLIIALVILYRVGHQHASINEFSLLSLYIMGGLIGTSTLLANLVVNPEPYRPNQVTIAAAIVLLGVALWWATDRAQGSRGAVLRGVLLTIILLGVVWTPYTIYYENQHISEHEFEGTEHHLEHRSPEVMTWSDSMSRRLSQYLLGTHNVPVWEDRVFGRSDTVIPKYLGYDNPTSIRDWAPNSEFYLITKERDTEWYKTEPPNRYPYIRYYTDENVSELHYDTRVSKTYSNGGYTIWWANALE